MPTVQYSAAPPMISQIATLVVQPALKAIGLYSRAAELLVLATGAHESNGYSVIAQIGGGPALGYWQMEPATHDDIWENWLGFQNDIVMSVSRLAAYQSPSSHASNDNPGPNQLAWNALYAAAMCRIHYYRAPFKLSSDIEPTPAWLASIWKQHYNTPQGRGTEAEFLAHYTRYVLNYQLSTVG